MTTAHADLEPAEIRLIGATEFTGLVDRAAAIYGAAMRRDGSLVAQRRDVMAGHVQRDDFVAAVATTAGELIGFGYGYHGRPGEWWHDVVAGALGRQQAREWLADAFEVAELHVAPEHHGQGTGRRLLDTLLDCTSTSTVVLSTHDRESPARALYRSVGFVDLLRNFRFPGSIEVYAVLGLTR